MPNSCQLPDKDDSLSNRVIGDQVRLLAINQIDERLGRYRLAQPKLEQQMLGRHKSWVNRRLALIERLCNEAREGLRLGLITPTQARHLTRLPRGNQDVALQSATHAALTSRELSGMVDLLLASSTQQQTQFVLEKPRQAIAQSQDHHIHQWDPRLSAAGNRIAKRLGFLLDSLAKMNTWLRFEGRGQLQVCDRAPLLSGFAKLQQEATLLIEANDDFVKELELP